ncbi:hypothetical protein [Mucilaginibacter frigoritolerans]|nr:hypothetical protein [Mucilaginibacter frigoritolerans]
MDNYGIDEKKLRITVKELTRTNKSDQALKLLDSLIYLNKQNGYLYFERGYVEGYNFHSAAAIKDFEMAKSLHYDNNACQSMIDLFTKK